MTIDLIDVIVPGTFVLGFAYLGLHLAIQRYRGRKRVDAWIKSGMPIGKAFDERNRDHE